MVLWPRLDGRRLGPQAVFGAEALEVRGGLAQLDDQPCGGIPCTILFVRAIVLPERFRPQGNHGTPVWMEERGAHQLMRIRDRTVPRHCGPTRGTVHGRGGKISRAIAGAEVVAIEPHPRCKRLATSVERCFRPCGVTMDMRHPVTSTAKECHSGAMVASQFTQGQCSSPGDHWAWRLSGNCCLCPPPCWGRCDRNRI
jgi:hypothetical protein